MHSIGVKFVNYSEVEFVNCGSVTIKHKFNYVKNFDDKKSKLFKKTK